MAPHQHSVHTRIGEKRGNRSCARQDTETKDRALPKQTYPFECRVVLKGNISPTYPWISNGAWRDGTVHCSHSNYVDFRESRERYEPEEKERERDGKQLPDRKEASLPCLRSNIHGFLIVRSMHRGLAHECSSENVPKIPVEDIHLQSRYTLGKSTKETFAYVMTMTPKVFEASLTIVFHEEFDIFVPFRDNDRCLP